MCRNVRFLSPDLSIQDAWERTRAHQAPSYLVGTPERLEGVVSRGALEASWKRGDREQRLAVLIERDMVHVHPDHPLDVVIDRLVASGGVLVVVSRADDTKTEGIVTPEVLLRMRVAVSSPERLDADPPRAGTDRSILRSAVEGVGDREQHATGMTHLRGGKAAERGLDG